MSYLLLIWIKLIECAGGDIRRFLSAFLIEHLSRLEQDAMDTTQVVLIDQTQVMRNSSLGPYVPADFFPPGYIIVVDALLHTSLGIMLLATSIAMLIKT